MTTIPICTNDQKRQSRSKNSTKKKKSRKRKRQSQTTTSSSLSSVLSVSNPPSSSPSSSKEHVQSNSSKIDNIHNNNQNNVIKNTTAQKKKKKRRKRNNNGSGIRVIRKMLGRHMKLYSLRDFLHQYVPTLELPPSSSSSSSSLTAIHSSTTTTSTTHTNHDTSDSVTMNQIWDTIISPEDTLQSPTVSSQISKLCSKKSTNNRNDSSRTTSTAAAKTTVVAAAASRWYQPTCRESVSSLVDNVIWSLLQRRERWRRPFMTRRRKRNNKENNTTKNNNNNSNKKNRIESGDNVFIQGYILASEETYMSTTTTTTTTTTTFPYTSYTSSSLSSSQAIGARSCPNMPSGGANNVICIHPNRNVSFCKTSNYFRLLHTLIGDDILRMILLHTKMFIPLMIMTGTQQQQQQQASPTVAVVDLVHDDDENETFINNDNITRQQQQQQQAISDVSSDSCSSFNYFLLCGTPPNLINSYKSNTFGRKGYQNCCLPSSSNNNSTKKRKRADDNDNTMDDTTVVESNNDVTTKRCRNQRHKRTRHSPPVEPKMRPNAIISRHSLYYSNSYIPHVGLPSKHVLNTQWNKDGSNKCTNVPTVSCGITNAGTMPGAKQLPRDSSSVPCTNAVASQTARATTTTTNTAEKLLHLMVNLHETNRNNSNNIGKVRTHCRRKRKRWRRLRDKGIEMCQQIQTNHQKCDYHRILNKYCPLPSEVCDNRRDSSTSPAPTLSQLAMAYAPSTDVFSFVSSILRNVFPMEFWGTEHNFSKVLDCVQLFVNLRRKEKLPNKRLLHGIKVTKMMWLQSGNDCVDMSCNGTRRGRLSRTDHQAVASLTLNVFRWVFHGFIIPLLRSNFYVTETEFCSQRVMFYRKPVWTLFRSLSMKKFTSGSAAMGQQLTELHISEALQRYISCKLGISRLRLLPKATGVRPISQLSKRGPCPINDLRPTFVSNNKRRDVPIGSSLSQVGPLEEGCIDSSSTMGLIQIGSKLRHRGRDTSTLLSSLAAHTSNPKFSISQRLPVNTILKDLFEVLKYECRNESTVYGAGLESLSDFFPRYREFITAVKREQHPTGKLCLYFGSVDVEKCYDNIRQDHLLKLTRHLVVESDYLIQKEKVLQAIGCFQQAGGGGVSTTQKTQQQIGPPASYDPFHQSIISASWRREQRIRGSLLLGTKRCSLAKRGNLLRLLQEHLKQNLLVSAGRYGNRYFVQNNGIAQGSVLSTLLCNLYYGNIERQILAEGEQPSIHTRGLEPWWSISNRNLLARLVDDFIFITTKKQELEDFIRKMNKGKPELGAKINKEKTVLSIPLDSLEVASEGIPGNTGRNDDPDNCYGRKVRMFPWCGMLFDIGTGEVRVDYSRFGNNRARDSLTVDRAGDDGLQLQTRMIGFVRPRCQPILFDSSINSFRVVVTNYYQMMLFGAIKTLEYLKSSDLVFSNTTSTSFFMRCVGKVSHVALGLIRSALKRASPDAVEGGSSGSKFCLSTDTATWLCWRAFDDIFRQHGDFMEVSKCLSYELAKKGKHLALDKVVIAAFRELGGIGLLPLQGK